MRCRHPSAGWSREGQLNVIIVIVIEEIVIIFIVIIFIVIIDI